MKEKSALPRIAASSYLNTAPLIWSFLHGSNRETVDLLTDEAPARCADMLARGEVEAALVPVIEYQRIPDVSIVPNVCVGSHSAVRSVVLASKTDDLKQIRRAALDESSRTSVALVRIIFREFLGFEPYWQVMQPDLAAMLEENDAALVIGDPAMKLYQTELAIFDLATVWHQYTGLGFVFAMWMVRERARDEVRAIDFSAARDEGLAQLDQIVTEYQARLGISRAELQSYLTRNISFELNDELVAGLELFFKLAGKHKLIAQKRDLKMVR